MRPFGLLLSGFGFFLAAFTALCLPISPCTFRLGLLVSLWACAYFSSMLQVEPRTAECFFEDLKIGDKMTVNFEVIRGGLLDIEFKLSDPMGNLAFQRLAFFNHKCVFCCN